MKVPLSVTVGLGFIPFAVFLVAAQAVSSGFGLWAASAAAIAIAVLNLAARRPPRTLEIGSVALFVGLAGVTAIAGWHWTFMTLRLAVDSGLLLIIAVTLAIGRPFTMEYAKERVPAAVWRTPLFISVNNRISAVWAAVFLVLVVAHAMNAGGFGLTVRGDLIITWVVLVAAVTFTARYPAYARRTAPAAGRAVTDEV